MVGSFPLIWCKFFPYVLCMFLCHSWLVRLTFIPLLVLLLQLRPGFADAWSNLASAYMRKGRLTEAAQCCRQALAINPLMVFFAFSLMIDWLLLKLSSYSKDIGCNLLPSLSIPFYCVVLLALLMNHCFCDCCLILQVDAHSNLGNLMKAQGLVQEVSRSIWCAFSCFKRYYFEFWCLLQSIICSFELSNLMDKGISLFLMASLPQCNISEIGFCYTTLFCYRQYSFSSEELGFAVWDYALLDSPVWVILYPLLVSLFMWGG